MGCWTADGVCPAHVRRGEHATVIGLAARAGLFSGHEALKALAATRARAAAGHVDTPDAVVLAMRAAKGTASGAELARRFGAKKSAASRILRGATYKHLQGAAGCGC